MISYRNTFRQRTADQRDGDSYAKFLRSFASEVIDLLPDGRWDRLLVIRSAPGAGKTSLLRVLQPHALMAVCDDASSVYDDLARRLADAGAIHDKQPRKLGFRISLNSTFRDLVDLQSGSENARKLFFRFLDAQIIREFLLALIDIKGCGSYEELQRFQLQPRDPHSVWVDRLGGTLGSDLWEWANGTIRAIHSMLDSVLPDNTNGIPGHCQLYSLKALSESRVVMDGVSIDLQALLMIDDGQWLAAEQRKILLKELVERDLTIGRWYTERHEALSSDEIIGDGEPSRRYEILELEQAARKMHSRRAAGRRTRRFESALLSVADRRAYRPLIECGDNSETPFSQHIGNSDSFAVDDHDSRMTKRVRNAVETVQRRLAEIVESKPQYEQWVAATPSEITQDTASSEITQDTAFRLRETEILIERDINKPQPRLFDIPMDHEDMIRGSSSAVKHAARLFVHKEFKIPYYFGADRIAKLGDHNFDQFLRICGDLFDEMLALLTLGRPPDLSAQAQERILAETSQHVWSEIPQRRSHGLDIQRILMKISSLAQEHTYRPTAPYAPGVSGIAITMSDRARLLDPDFRAQVEGADPLFNALGGAIGHNLLIASTDRFCKGEFWMVMYLNRLLCVHYHLPIGLGGWRPVKLEDMCRWLADPPVGDLRGEIASPRQLVGVG